MKERTDTVKIRCRLLSQNPEAVNYFRLSRWCASTININYGLPRIKDHHKVLLIGNSFTLFNGCFQLLQEIARSQGHDLDIRAHLHPGADFGAHLSIPMMRQTVQEGGYDYAILQDQSSAHARYIKEGDQSIAENTQKLIDEIRKLSVFP